MSMIKQRQLITAYRSGTPLFEIEAQELHSNQNLVFVGSAAVWSEPQFVISLCLAGAAGQSVGRLQIIVAGHSSADAYPRAVPLLS